MNEPTRVGVSIEDELAVTRAQRNAFADSEARLQARVIALERDKAALMKAVVEQAAERRAELKAVS